MNATEKIIFRNKAYHCPIEVVIGLINGKWKSELIWLIRDEPKRFGEIRRLLGGISAKVLTEQLRELEHDGLIVRESFPVIPPRVEYTLSEKGKSLWPVLDSLYEWGVEYLASYEE